MPLKFPYEKPISAESKDFIIKALTIDEEKRLSWDEAFNHKVLLIPHSGHVEAPKLKLDEVAKKILRSIQELVQAHNLHVAQIFKNFDKEKQGALDPLEFFQLLAVIDPRITQQEANHVFRIVDTSGDGKVTLEEFSHIFECYDFADINDHA